MKPVAFGQLFQKLPSLRQPSRQPQQQQQKPQGPAFGHESQSRFGAGFDTALKNVELEGPQRGDTVQFGERSLSSVRFGHAGDQVQFGRQQDPNMFKGGCSPKGC